MNILKVSQGKEKKEIAQQYSNFMKCLFFGMKYLFEFTYANQERLIFWYSPKKAKSFDFQ